MASPAAIAWNNKADAGGVAISARGSAGTASVVRLLNPHVGAKWRDNTNSTYVLVDFGTSVSIDTVMLAGLSGTAPEFRVRLSSADGTGIAGDVSDSGGSLFSGLPWFDPDYGLFVYLLAAPVSARYLRVDISEASAIYIEAGRIFAGTRSAFGINFTSGWSKTPERRSVDAEGIGGQTFIDLRRGKWKASFPFGFLSEDDRNDFIEQNGVRIVNTGHIDFLWIRDPDSSNLSRDCLWGYLDGDQPVVQDLLVDPPVFSVTYSVKQRL